NKITARPARSLRFACSYPSPGCRGGSAGHKPLSKSHIPSKPDKVIKAATVRSFVLDRVEGIGMRAAGGLGLAAVLALAAPATGQPQDSMPAGDWRTINRDLAATRYSPLDEINKSNVTNLVEKWSFPLRGFNTAVPLVVGGVMYFPAGSRVVALN